MVVTIPLMDSTSWENIKKHLCKESKEDPYQEDQFFDLYEAEKDVHVDNQVKARFWHLVALHLQIKSDVSQRASTATPWVHGIIGGRSGSMDLPAVSYLNVL